MPKCPRCNQPIRNERFGIYLPNRKARILDVLAAAGDDGIGLQDLIAAVWGRKRRARQTVASHISQINDLLAGTKVRVRSERGKTYYLQRREKRAA